MSDLFGYQSQVKITKDISDQRPSVAEQKAILCKRLGELLRKAPESICSGDVKTVREWKIHHEAAKKKFQNSRSSVNELQSAINQMESYL